MPFVFLDEVDAISLRHRVWSNRVPAPLWFRRRDFLGREAMSLSDAVASEVVDQTDVTLSGPIAMLGQVRTFGWLFNPITCYFCFDESGQRVVALVAEVENTPWHERHAYVVGPPGSYRFPKALHVSPFLPMDLDYELTYSEPTERSSVVFKVYRGEELLLIARSELTRSELDTAGIRRLLLSYPAMSLRISTAIYRQAVKLKRMGAPFFPHPKRSGQPAVADSRTPR